MGLKGMIGVKPNGSQIESNPPTLRVEAVKVNDYDDYFRKIIGGLAVANQVRVVHCMKAQVAIAPQCLASFADSVNAGNKIL